MQDCHGASSVLGRRVQEDATGRAGWVCPSQENATAHELEARPRKNVFLGQTCPYFLPIDLRLIPLMRSSDWQVPAFGSQNLPGPAHSSVYQPWLCALECSRPGQFCRSLGGSRPGSPPPSSVWSTLGQPLQATLMSLLGLTLISSPLSLT